MFFKVIVIYRFGYTTVVAGARMLTTLQTGNYTNPDLSGSLAPHSNTKMTLFDILYDENATLSLPVRSFSAFN